MAPTNRWLSTLLIAPVLAACCQRTDADEPGPFNVFVLAGQSNMAGADSVVGPAGFLQTPADRATLFTTAPLPDGAKSDSFVPWQGIQGHKVKGKLSHGPEVGIARELHQAGWRNVAIIKVHANFGGNHKVWPWGKGGYLFNAWTKFIDDRLNELRKRGRSIRIRGFVWHQGIDDAIHGQFAKSYERNLTHLIGALRERYKAKNAPFVLARSVNSQIAQPKPDPAKKSPMAAVRRAQMRMPTLVQHVACINVDDLPNVNTHHFPAAGQLVIGGRFGQAILQIMKETKVSPSDSPRFEDHSSSTKIEEIMN